MLLLRGKTAIGYHAFARENIQLRDGDISRRLSIGHGAPQLIRSCKPRQKPPLLFCDRERSEARIKNSIRSFGLVKPGPPGRHILSCPGAAQSDRRAFNAEPG